MVGVVGSSPIAPTNEIQFSGGLSDNFPRVSLGMESCCRISIFPFSRLLSAPLISFEWIVNNNGRSLTMPPAWRRGAVPALTRLRQVLQVLFGELL